MSNNTEYAGGTAVMPTSLIEMTLSARNLLNKDILSKSDPFCIVSMKDSWQDKFYEIGKTEIIQDNLNPEWIKKFILNYNFEIVQRLRFEVWDADPTGKDFLGRLEITLAEIVAHSGRQFVGKLRDVSEKDYGQLVIVTEELSSCKQIVQIQFCSKRLKKISWLFKNNPFLVVSRSNEDATFSAVIKSETKKSTQNPVWMPITMRVRSLCNGDYDRTIKLNVYDHSSTGNHKLIGTSETCPRTLAKGPSENIYHLTHPRKPNSIDFGSVELLSVKSLRKLHNKRNTNKFCCGN